jgi:cytoskeleton protein RodZ
MSQVEQISSDTPIPALGVGDQLKAAREYRRMSLGEVSQAIKISPRVLEQVEANAWGEMPGHTFARGMVRSYAKLVQLDPEPLLKALEDAPLPKLPALNIPSPMQAALPVAGEAQRRDRLTVAAGLLLVALAVVAYYVVPDGWLNKTSDSMTSPEGPLAAPPATLIPPVPPTAVGSEAPGSGPAATQVPVDPVAGAPAASPAPQPPLQQNWQAGSIQPPAAPSLPASPQAVPPQAAKPLVVQPQQSPAQPTPQGGKPLVLQPQPQPAPPAVPQAAKPPVVQPQPTPQASKALVPQPQPLQVQPAPAQAAKPPVVQPQPMQPPAANLSPAKPPVPQPTSPQSAAPQGLQPAAQPVAAAAGAPASWPKPPPAATVVIRFPDTSWVEVKDGKGAVVLAGNFEAGSSRYVRGEGPFTVSFGNASGVILSYRGKPIDLKPHTKQNVARLTLE